MSDIQIRPVSAEDYNQWLPLWREYQGFYQVDLHAVTDVSWQRMLDPAEPINAALAWDQGKAVGMVHFIYHRSCWTVENACYLQDLLVTGQNRARGVGRQLIEFVYARAREAGCTKVHWLTHESNHNAIELYQRVAERPGFIQFRKAI